MSNINEIKNNIKKCRICEKFLINGCRPIVSFSEKSKIILIGQAPGIKVHLSGIPWDDKSGENLRTWLGVSKEEFYNPDLFGIIPMGFCYPGKGKSGDLQPRKECAPQWHKEIFQTITKHKLFLLVGGYAQNYYLKEKKLKTLTETVRNYQEFLPTYFPLPHPSPRNNIWMKKNNWFLTDVVPNLKIVISQIIEA